MNIEMNKIYNMDCIEGMKLIQDKSIDMILCDLPYATTNCPWDTLIPFDKLWKEYERIIKNNGAIVLTAQQPFTTKLIISNPKLFRYEWIWQKGYATGFPNAKKMPLKEHENILVFYKKLPTYNPQGLVKLHKPKEKIRKTGAQVYGKNNKSLTKPYVQEYTNYPKSIIQTKKESGTFHPTQKPVVLFEYLIKTYTNEGDLVLDNCIGSGTTAIACINTNRNYIGFELTEEYYNKSLERIKTHKKIDSIKLPKK